MLANPLFIAAAIQTRTGGIVRGGSKRLVKRFNVKGINMDRGWHQWRRRIAWRLWSMVAPEGNSGEIRPNEGSKIDRDLCEDTDEVIGPGFLHVEQMDRNIYWARLDLPDGRAIVMQFRSRAKITLEAAWD